MKILRRILIQLLLFLLLIIATMTLRKFNAPFAEWFNHQLPKLDDWITENTEAIPVIGGASSFVPEKPEQAPEEIAELIDPPYSSSSTNSSPIPDLASFELGLEIMKGNNRSDADFEAALGHFSDAVEDDPGFKKAWLFRGIANFELGNYQEVVSDMSKCIQLDPKYAEAFFYRGMAYDKLAYPDAACDDLKSANGFGYEGAESMRHTLCGEGKEDYTGDPLVGEYE